MLYIASTMINESRKGKAADKKKYRILEAVLVLLVFCICLTGAFVLPVDECPDESGRLILADWLAGKGTLPVGNESELIIRGWGFSYALRPYLSTMIGALFMRTASLLNGSPRIMLTASRMCSVLSVTASCFFCLRIGHRIFEHQSAVVLLAAIVCFLPQVIFLGMYQNNDALSLCAASMILYSFVNGYDCKWSAKSCLLIAVSFSIAMLSYYSVYGWILACAISCVIAVLTDPEIPDKGRLIYSRMLLILGICLLLVGWFFVRNAFLHNGDFLGIVSEKTSRALLREQGYKLYPYTCFREEGKSVIEFLRFHNHEWLRWTAESFVGRFGNMIYYLPHIQYSVYYMVFVTGVLQCFFVLMRSKPSFRNALLMLMILVSSGITLLLHFWQSYTRDYQPQGRYIITVVLLISFATAYGFDQMVVFRAPGEDRMQLDPATVLTLVWLLLFVWAWFGTMIKRFHSASQRARDKKDKA